MGCLGGMSTIRYTRNSIYASFSGQFFFKFSKEKIVMGKKIVAPCLDVIMNAFFPRNLQGSYLFARKARVNAERVPPGHPIILLKSNKFNMAAVSVKRSINKMITNGKMLEPLLNSLKYSETPPYGHFFGHLAKTAINFLIKKNPR